MTTILKKKEERLRHVWKILTAIKVDETVPYRIGFYVVSKPGIHSNMDLTREKTLKFWNEIKFLEGEICVS